MGRGKGWLKGGHLSAETKEKLRLSQLGKSTGKAIDPQQEILRKRKIALSMKGNKNGATSFRRRQILWNDLQFKSKWELNVAKFLNSNNFEWKYEDVQYSLSETTSYTPDFSIYENGKLVKHIEVKGYFRKENREKFEKFQMMFPDILVEIWNKEILVRNSIEI